MSKKSIFSSKSIIDFIYMFSSNILKKGFGFVREIILAYFFGSSILYANYLLLKTVSDFFSQLTLGNALQTNLMPKFTRLYNISGSVNMKEVYYFSKSFSWKLFLMSQLIQMTMIWYINPVNKGLYIVLSMLLGLVMSANFFNSIFLIALQAKGDFKKHSVATTVNLFVSTIVLYPFVLLSGIIGIVIARLVGVMTLTLKYIKPLIAESGSVKGSLSFSDFNLSLMLLGNFANIIMLLSRFVAGADGSNNIAFYTYAIVFLNIFLTAVVMNINTLVLKIISVKKDYRIILFSALISTIIGGIFILIISSFSVEIISFAFERGAFTASDTLITSSYIKDISWIFIFIFIASALFQPYFTLPQSYLKKTSKHLARPFIISVLLLLAYFYLNNQGVRFNSLVMIYVLSFISFVLSIIAFIKYYRYET